MVTKPKVLLICSAPHNKKLYANTLPPLGILGIASYLEKYDISVDVLDCNIGKRKKLDFKDYDLTGLSVNMANITSSLETIKYIKMQNPNTKIIVGGPSCISNPYYFTQNENIDAICISEGEEPFLEYIVQESFIKGHGIPGLYTRTRKGNFLYGGDRDYVNNLDCLPFPALKKVDLKRYNVPIRKAFPVSSIITSRGCPFHCIFCFHSMGYKWRARSSMNVVDEIEWQISELGVREICIQDDNFSLDINRAKQIFDLMFKRKVKIKLQFQNGLRVDYADFELLDKMKQAGVWLIGLAPETGSSRIVEKIQKKIDLESIKQVVRWCRKLDISTYAYFMVGFPFETTHDLKKTASFIKELNTDFLQLARVTPMPATPLYELCVNEDTDNTFGEEQGCFFEIPKFKIPEISDKNMLCFIKQIHRNFYLNPTRMIRLMKILPLPQLIKLFFYTVKTRNV